MFAAKQLDATMTNPNSAQMLEFLYHQLDVLFERQGIAKSARQTERMLLIKDRGDGASTSDAPNKPTEQVMAIYGRPQVSKIPGSDVAPYRPYRQ
jgi:hypothetical protein